MDLKTYKKYIKMLVIIIAILVSIAVSTGNGYFAVLVVTFGILAKINLRKKIDDVFEDELVLKVAEKASYMTIQVVCLLFALLSVFLTTFGEYMLVGNLLAYSTLFILLVNILFRYMYSRKYGLM
ncbi:conserved hypothetical protein [Methanococcus vannielii SB]|uniref:DUF2178 domain-containing protein n=1 Tax=Methanococcus vannielii (strain ATCC 35089 / DSM 1224 / JCM 13029 / OCM 148 / SB) TaxID=406327 RepID=A6USD8_METVS|nr:DUF2178 domain-containing protein [Methanococcus vannielii]ABR55410.1 conserved hypothetical protein [Methanococcus vannielii SB]